MLARRVRIVRRLTQFLVLWVTFSAPESWAQNLATNSDFEATLAPWSQFLSSSPDPLGAGAAPQWAAVPDYSGNSSGSALIAIASTASTDATNAASGIDQCVPLSLPTPVHFVHYAGSFFVPTSVAIDASVSATLEIRLYADAACTSFLTGATQAEVFLPTLEKNVWHTLDEDHFVPPGTLPITVGSAEFRAYLRQAGAALPQNSYSANFDRLVLVFDATTPVRLQEFDVQ